RFARGRAAGADVTSAFSFALQKGEYVLTARASGASGADSTRVAVESFADQPLLSDVLLSPAIRVLQQNEEAGAGELKRGAYGIVRSPYLKLTPSQPSLWYYLEAYAPAGAA